MKTAELEFDFTGLHNFVRLMDSAGKYVVKVGIFGNKNTRGIIPTGNAPLKSSSFNNVLTNSEIGVVHEFGSQSGHIPARSFLRMPLSLKSKEIIEKASIGALELLARGNIMKILDNLGHACVIWIQYAFATRGFGSWAPDKPATIKRKGSNIPLIDTHQLRNSIASQVAQK